MKLKQVLSVGFLSLISGFGAYIFFSKEKIDRVINNLKISVKDARNFNIKSGNLVADLYLKAYNQTNESVSLNTFFLEAKEIRIYDKINNKILAVSNLNLNKIEITARGGYEFPKLQVSIPLIIGAEIALSQLTKQKQDFLKRLRFELDIKAGSIIQTIHF